MNNSKISSFLSKKISFISFAYAVLVVALHAYCASSFNLDIDTKIGDSIALYLQKFIVQDLSRCAVPTFFMISGYLYFVKVQSIKDVFINIRKRIRTLFIPYVIFNFLYFVWTYIIEVLMEGEKLDAFLNLPRGIPSLIIHILFIFEYNPIAWYVFALLIFVAISPLLYYSLKSIYTATITLLFFFILGIIEVIPILPGRNYFMFFVYLGAFVATYGNDVINASIRERKHVKLIVALSILGFVISQVIIAAFGFYDEIYDSHAIRFVFEILLSLSMWFLADLVSTPNPKWYYSFSFPLYMIHPAIQSFFKSIIYRSPLVESGGGYMHNCVFRVNYFKCDTWNWAI